MIDDVKDDLIDAFMEFGHADLGPPVFAPSRETWPNPEGVEAPMPDGPPSVVQRQASVDSVLTLDHLSGSLSSPLPTAVAPASGAHMDSLAQYFDGLRLLIQSQEEHKVENPDTEDRECVMSNMKSFKIEVTLVNSSNELVDDVHVGLHASLLYENGQNVPRANDKEEILTGEKEVVIIGGRGLFKLKLGASVLTSKHDRQRFRVNISPNSEHLSTQFPQLTVLSEPFKSITKLDRKTPPSRGGDGGGRFSAPPPRKWPRLSLPVLPCCSLRKRGPSEQTVARTVAAAPSKLTKQIDKFTKNNELILDQLKQLRNHLQESGYTIP